MACPGFVFKKAIVMHFRGIACREKIVLGRIESFTVTQVPLY